MAETLKDPSKPAGYVFPEDVNADGSATRNDGGKLKPARKNPWYVLATIYGEVPVGTEPWQIDPEIADKNRRVWNGWACAAMDRKKWPELAEAMGVPEQELEPLSGPEMAEVLQRFRDRIEDQEAELPDPADRVDFSETYFTNPLGFEKYVVANTADFKRATFTSTAIFHRATFTGDAMFQRATFTGDAFFLRATFTGDAFFHRATFTSIAFFHRATFTGDADFSSAKFRSATDFGKVVFETHVPEFHAAELFADTTFELPDSAAEQRKHWPPVTGRQDRKVMPADKQKRAYNRLRLFMNQTLQTEEEQFFHRREMACKRELAGKKGGEAWHMAPVYWLYEKLSDYGYSVKRPALGLLTAWGVGLVWLCFYMYWYQDAALANSILDAAGISFSNIFPFFGLGGRFVDPNFYEDLGRWTTFVASLQTILGFLFLFLLGLGLRSRFRLR